MLLLLLSLFLIVFVPPVNSLCGPAPFDFTAFGSKQQTFTDGRKYSFNVCNSCSCCAGYPAAWGCASWNNDFNVVNMGTSASWSFITPNDPSSGAKVVVSAGRDVDDSFCMSNPNAAQFTVYFKCLSLPGDDSFSITSVASATNGCQWVFTVNSAAVCALYPPLPPPTPTPGSSSSLSGGWIFIIILLIATFVYCVGGVLYMKFRRQATGWDLIPNSGFWRELGSLIKDGCRFSYSKLRGLCGGGMAGTPYKSTYDT